MSAVTSGLDHVILGVGDLDRAAAWCGDALGLHVGTSGVHPSRGTMNRIIVVGSSYIELLAAQPGLSPTGFIGSLLTGGHGWVGFALTMTDTDRALSYLGAQGFLVEGPTDGRLDTGDEFSRSWQTLRPLNSTIGGAPFLIRHQAEGEERRRLLAGTAGLREHRLGAQAISALLIAGENDDSTAFYERYLDLRPGVRTTDRMLKARTCSYTLEDGTQLTIAMPEDPSVGPVAEKLSTSGPGLMAITLSVSTLTDAVRDLRAQGIGVRVEEPNNVLVAAQLQYRQTLGARIGLIQAASAHASPPG